MFFCPQLLQPCKNLLRNHTLKPARLRARLLGPHRGSTAKSMSLIPRNAAEMPTAASKSGSRLPSRGLLVDHYQGPASSQGKPVRLVPVGDIARRQAQAEMANAQWQDEALDARSSRFAGITGHHRKGAFQSTIPGTLESAEEREGWYVAEEGGGAGVRVHYLGGNGNVYDLVFGFLKKHEKHIHLLGYDNNAFRDAPGKWDEKFRNIGLDLLGGDLRVVLGESGTLGIVKGDAIEDVHSEVQSEVTDLGGLDSLTDFIGQQRFSPMKLGHELKVDPHILKTVAEEKAELRQSAMRNQARSQRSFLKRLRKLEGKRRAGKKKSAVSPEKAYVSNLTGVVRLNRPATTTFDNEMSWKVRNDWQIKKPSFVPASGQASKSVWVHSGSGEEEARRVAEERRIEKLVERKGELSLKEEASSAACSRSLTKGCTATKAANRSVRKLLPVRSWRLSTM